MLKKNTKPILSTLIMRGSKYMKTFFVPTIKQSMISGGVNTVTNIFDYWMQKYYESNQVRVYG